MSFSKGQHVQVTEPSGVYLQPRRDSKCLGVVDTTRIMRVELVSNITSHMAFTVVSVLPRDPNGRTLFGWIRTSRLKEEGK